ncbi:MAG: FxDxF family PEP-CTERM protein [Pseudomonadota bacterium]
MCLPLASVSAATYDFFNIQVGKPALRRISQESGAFSDQINFSLLERKSLEVHFRDTGESLPNIIDFNVKLYSANHVLLNKFYTNSYDVYFSLPRSEINDPSLLSPHALINDLAIGNYYLIITGKTTATTPLDIASIVGSSSLYVGPVNNSYGNYEVLIAAIPEPETYAMLLLGLGSIGYVKRKKRIQNNLA